MIPSRTYVKQLLYCLVVLGISCKNKNSNSVEVLTEQRIHQVGPVDSVTTNVKTYPKIKISAVNDSLNARFGKNAAFTRIYVPLSRDEIHVEYITGKVRIDSSTIFCDVISPDNFLTQSVYKGDNTTETFSLSELDLRRNLPIIIKAAKNVNLADKYFPGRVSEIQVRKISAIHHQPLYVAQYTSSDNWVGVNFNLNKEGKLIGEPQPFNYHDSVKINATP